MIEELDDRSRMASELVEHSNRWHVGWEKVGFIDRYLRGELNIGLWAPLGDQPYNGFVVSVREPRRNGGDIGGGTNTLNTKASGDDFGIEASEVFSTDIELMEEPQKVVPSLVRFERFYNPSFGIGESLYEFAPLDSLKCDGVGSNGEVHLVFSHLVAAKPFKEAVCQHIKGATNGVDIDSKFDVEPQGEVFSAEDCQNIVLNMRLRLFDTRVEVIFHPSVELLLKGWEIGYGPVNSGLGSK